MVGHRSARAPLNVNARDAQDLADLAERVAALQDRVERRLRQIEGALTARVYTLTGVLTELRDLDAAVGTADDVRNVLATLIHDLQSESKLLGG